ncbi:hypothetical protein [Luteolibacter sp. Populi]|uniref:hypothetical protein n=1 Tax=Luteolibacter sp. Populi TaxID=3230487 RepID=UPI0034650D22
MARIGDYLRPELGIIDYQTPALQQAQMQMQTGDMLAKALAGIGEVIGERRQAQSDVKASGKLIREAAEAMPNELGGMLNIADFLDSKEGDLNEKLSLAKTIAPMMELGISKYESDRDFGLKDRGMKVQEGQLGLAREQYNLDAGVSTAKWQREQQTKRGQAVGRFAALMESTAPYADKLPQMQGTQKIFLEAIQNEDYDGALATVDALEKNLGKQLDGAMKPLELKPHKMGGELNGKPYELDLLVDPQGNFYDINRNPINRQQQQGAWGDGSGGESLPGASIVPELDANGMISAATEAQVKQAARGYLSRPDVDMDKVPLGMRNNNPTNIIFPGMGYAQRVGALGGSRNQDSGSSKPGGGSYNQLVFADPVTGMKAGADLAARKYSGGMKTAAQLIAGSSGWTPGNNEAAANVARAMGVSPGADLRLNDPSRMKSFLKALVKQEHGNAGGLYKDDVYNRALGIGAPTQAPAQGGGMSLTDAMRSFGVLPEEKRPAARALDGIDISQYMRESPAPADPRAAEKIDGDLLMKAMQMGQEGTTPRNAAGPAPAVKLDPRIFDGIPQAPTLGQRPLVSPKVTPQEAQEMRRGESGDKRLETTMQEAGALAGTIANLKQTDALLDQVQTGFGAETITAAKRILGQDVASAEQLQTLLGDQVMARVAQTKGAVTDREMELFRQYSANFGKTNDGNKKIVAFAIKAAERAKKIQTTIAAGFRTGKSPFEIEAEVQAVRDGDSLEGMLAPPAPPPPRGIPLDEEKENEFWNTKPR